MTIVSSRVVDTGEVRLHALVTTPEGARTSALGRGFLLVHGLASNAQLWRPFARRLTEADWPSVAVDQRGHGLSSTVDGFDFATLVTDLVAVLDAVGLERAIVAGQSWGGSVVLELARRFPDRVDGVVCVDGGFLDLQAQFPDRDAMHEALRPPALAGTPLAEAERWMAQRTHGWDREAPAAQLANFAVRPDGTIAPNLTLERHLAILDHLWDHRPVETAGDVTAPTLLLPVAESDSDRTPAKREAVEALAKALPRSRVHWFDDYDHDVHAQAPDEVAGVVLDAIRDGFFEVTT